MSKAKENAMGVSGASVTVWRLWLFRIIAITLVPALLFLLAELALRIIGYGYPTSATIKCTLNGSDAYCHNLEFGKRFFPRHLVTEFFPFAFPRIKAENTYRIYVMGGSAALGIPHPEFSFGRILQKMLQQQYPAVNFEVYNAAMVATNSHVALQIAKDLARHNTDLFIVYLGNNEVVGPYGAKTVSAPIVPRLSLIRAVIALKATKLGQLASNLTKMTSAQKNPLIGWDGLEMFLENQMRSEDPALETIYKNFQRNLEDIRRITCESEIGLIFSTVGCNLKDSPPFASLHRVDLTDTDTRNWDTMYQQAVEFESAGKYSEAIQCLLAASVIDDSFANLHFRMGRCHWAIGEYDQARHRYDKARQMDTLRLRADTRINKIIRNVAANKAGEGVYLADAVKAFESNSPYKTPGGELFYEHVHLNFKGNYILAKTILEQTENILPQWVKRQKVNQLALITELQCARDLAYTDWDRYASVRQIFKEYLSKPPFTNQLDYDENLRRKKQELKDLEVCKTRQALEKSAEQYRQAISKTPFDWHLRRKYGSLLEYLNYDRAAIQQYRKVLHLMPNLYQLHHRLGFLLAKQGWLREAVEHDLEAIRINPTYSTGYCHLGTLYLQQGKVDKAIKHYSLAIQYQANNQRAYVALAQVLCTQGKFGKEVEVLRRGLDFFPDALFLRYRLGLALQQQGRKDEAAKEFNYILQKDPNYMEARKPFLVAL